ncbi:LamG-like jellyroll fold domain-containing protein [Streptomyces sp. NPDC051994]|uniref:LamG-like jellyroll fold domain-containing protein n=1 Tax=unclassified Streptomyces TaxID=2593676 RepID=UPI00341E5A6C
MFQNADGTRTTQVYPRAVHYKKSNGTWADINTDLAVGTDGRWAEKANAQAPSFAAHGDDPALVTWTVDGSHQVSYGLQGAHSVPGTAKGSSFSYPEVASASDLVYAAQASGIKESFILHNVSAPTSWVFPLQLTGLAPSIDGSGNVLFKDEKGTVRLTVPHGYMEDAHRDQRSGEGAISTGVTYSLTTVSGAPALKVDLDAGWLRDPHRVFPVAVDPTAQQSTNATQTTFVETPYNTNFASDASLKAGSYDGGSHVASSYLLFNAIGSSTLQNDYIEKVELDINVIHSAQCSPNPVYVHQITGAWDPRSVATADQIPVASGTIGSASGYGGDTCGGVVTMPIDLGDTTSAAGTQLVQGWAHGGANYGLALMASSSDSNAWKVFDSVNTSYPPYLKVTYSAWGAGYAPSVNYTPSSYALTGSQQVKLTNTGHETWPTSTALKARLYDSAWHEQSVSAPATAIPSAVGAGGSVTMSGTIPKLNPGTNYQLCWDLYLNGTTSLHDTQGVAFENCTWISGANTPPQIDQVAPLSNTTVGVLSPQLYAAGHDPDNYPGNGLSYQFQVFDSSGSGTPVADSGWITSTSWAVPLGKLGWNAGYTWDVRVSDISGTAEGPWSNPIAFSTTVQQPLVTSHLGGSAGDGQGHDFNPQVGNYTTQATDASVKAVGPDLAVNRTYNSLDPRTATLFGAGWSSSYDMSVRPDVDGTGSAVLTSGNGRAERFGRNDFQLTQLAGIGDQTGDGIDDMIAVDYTTGKLWLYPGPDFSATKRKVVGSGGWNGMTWITGGDVTGDGIGDLVAVQPSDGTLWLYPGIAGGGFGNRVEIGTGGWNGMTNLAITPALGSDGRKDLAAVETPTGKLWAYPFNSDGTVGTRFEIGSGGWNGMAQVIGGDFNHDGHGDVVAAQSSDGTLWEYPGTGSGTLGTRVQIGTGGWNSMRDLAAVNAIPGDTSTGTDFVAVSKVSGVQYLYHSGQSWSGAAGTRSTTGMALYTPAAGEYETLAVDISGGWIMADKSGTTYTFDQPSTDGFLLTQITDRAHHAQNLHYTSGKLDTVTDAVSGRALHLAWTGDSRHIAKVTTDPVSGTDSTTALAWTYSYNAGNPDELDQVCAPPTGGNTAPACTGYGYTSGSHLRSTVLDAAPADYWRLADATGATGVSEVAVNEGNDNATFSASGLTLGQPGPTASSSSVAFDGQTGDVALPASLLSSASYASVGLWFNTGSSGSGVLFSYQTEALSKTSTTASYTPALYVGTSGKLYGQLWNGGVNPIATSVSVRDNKWHYAVLTASGNTQSLYLDGGLVGSLDGQVTVQGQPTDHIGAGFTGGHWPDEPHASTTSNTGYPSYFGGRISDVAFYDHALGVPAITQQWAAGNASAAELKSLTLPSGKTKLAVQYDTGHDRASQVTDANGGVWKIPMPQVNGSSQVYRGAVMGSGPAGYWRLSDAAGTQAANQIWSPRPTPNNGIYSNVALGADGPIQTGAGTPKYPAATFDGATSSVQLPRAVAPSQGPAAISLWFKTTSPGVLFSYQSFPVGSAHTSRDDWNPALYVGTDGKLHGKLWTSGTAMASSTSVTDGNWHLAVLDATSTNSQTLYLDGAVAAGPLSGTISPNGSGYLYIGAGTADNWPAAPTNTDGHFSGQISDVATFAHGLGASAIGNLTAQLMTDTGDFDTALIDNHPTGYWQLSDRSGNQAAETLSAAALSQNRGTYKATSCCAAGPWASGTSTGQTFDGASSYVQLPPTVVPDTAASASVELWFKTTGPGVLYGYQDFPLGGTHTNASDWNPALFVGSDNKLHGDFWSGSSTSATSTQTVTDGQWHYATLTATNTSQQLYLDGQPTGSPIAGTIHYNGEGYVYLGAGNVNGWANAPSDTNGHLSGSLSDFAYYGYALDPTVIADHYHNATTATSGTGMDAAAAYRASVVQAQPKGYWRLNDSSGAQGASDELGTALPDNTAGTYTSTTLNSAGPYGAADQGAATFDGAASTLQLPANAAPTQGPVSVELWFKTTTSGVLYSYQDFDLGAAHTTSDDWDPALYVGSDGKLHGGFWTAGAATTLASSSTVNDGKWHQAVLTGSDGKQDLYVDGTQSAETKTAGTIQYNGSAHVYIGAGTTDGTWPNKPASTNGYFTGSIAEVSYYPSQLNADTVTAHYQAMGSSRTATPVATVTVTDPGGHNRTYRSDANSGRVVSTTNADGDTTAYSYDTSGFLNTVTDPDGHSVTTGHDARGNAVSHTTCQNPGNCQSSYATYSLNSANTLDPQNDLRTSSTDALGSTTTYSYTASGDPATTTLPATGDFPQGRSVYTGYTSGTEQAVDSTGQPISSTQPAGLANSRSLTVDTKTYPTSSSLPAADATKYSYDTAGDLTKTVTPAGLATTYAYDNLGRLLSKTVHCTDCGPGQTTLTTSYTWDGQGNPLTQTDPATTDAVNGALQHNRRTGYVYDPDGDKTTQTVTDLNGNDKPRTTTWTYGDNTDQVAKVTDPAGRSTAYAYNTLGDVVTESDAAGTSQAVTKTRTYSPAGLLQQTAIANYTGNPNSPTAAHSQVIDSRAYDPAGRLATDTDAMGRTTHTYYNDDNTVAEIDLDSFHNADGTTRTVVEEQDTYDAAGHVTQRITGGGKTTVSNHYDAAGQLTSDTVDPAGLSRTTNYTYDAAGNVLTTKLADSTTTRETDIGYDLSGNPLTKTIKNTPVDLTTSYTYNQLGQVTSYVPANGHTTGADPAAFTTRFTYDTLGNLSSTTAPPTPTTRFDTTTGTPVTTQASTTTLIGYNTFGEKSSSEDANGDITTFTHVFDSAGEHTAVAGNTYTTPDRTKTFTSVTQTDYDPLGRPHTVTLDPGGLNRITTNTYDQLGNLTEADLPATGSATPVWRYTYDLDGEKLSATDPMGAVTQSTYDDLGRQATLSQIVRQTSHSGPGSAAVYTGSFGYDDAGNATSLSLPSGDTSTAAYNAAGERMSSTDALQRTTRYTYDMAGELTRTTQPGADDTTAGPSTTTRYDAAGRQTATAHLDANGTTLSAVGIGYDADGNAVSTTDADGNTATATFNAADRPTQQIQPVKSGTAITTAYGYDAAGNRTAYTDGNGNTTYYTYSTLGLIESTIDPATSAYPNLADRTYTAAYDPAGEQVGLVEPGGVTQTKVYDAAGHLTSATGNGAETPTTTRTVGYDADGRVTSLSTPTGSQTYSYDDRNHLWESAGPQGTASYTYDADGRLATRADSAGTTGFTYDRAGQVKTLTDPINNATLTYSYYPTGTVQSVDYGNGTSRSYTYDGQNNLTGDSLKTSSGTTASLAYSYFASGRLKTKTTTGVAGTSNNTYSYDGAGRLASWSNGSNATSYGYDGNGNLTASGASTATYSERNQLKNAAGTDYTYTARGTLSSATTGSTTTQSTYDAFDDLTAQGGQSYTYDALGRLASAPGHTFSYDGTTDHIASDGSETYSRTPGGDLVGISTSASKNLAYTDRHGDVIGTYTTAGTAVTNSAAYDPWGKPIATAGATPHLGYQGGWTDSATAQVNTASRWYNPSTAQFPSRDTAAANPVTSADGNLYAYANDDPLSNADPTGHYACYTPKFRGPRGGGGDDGSSSGESDTGTSAEPSHNYDLKDDYEPSYQPDYSSDSGFDWSTALEWTVGVVGVIAVGAALVTGVGEVAAGVGAVFSGLASLFSHRSCDTLTTRPKPKPKPDPHKLKPGKCDNCSSSDQNGTQNGPESGSTQQGQPGDQSSILGNPFNSGSTGSGGSQQTGGSCLIGGEGWVDYGATDPANGNRATGIEACLDSEYLATHAGSSTDPSALKPPGYDWARDYVGYLGNRPPGQWVNACHLLGKQFGGDGLDLRNLSTCARSTNATRVSPQDPGITDHMLRFENQVKGAIGLGQVVHYTVTPKYMGSRTVPVSYEMMANGYDPDGNPGISFDEVVPNQVYSVKFGNWRNLGGVTFGGKPVPTGVTP